MAHAPTITHELRDLEPTADGWARREPTGSACTTCTCGLTTGWVPKAEAVRVYRQHTPEPTPAASSFPAEITHDHLRAVCDALGIPADLTREVRTHATEGATVTMFVRDRNGRLIGRGDDALTATVHIPLHGADDREDPAHRRQGAPMPAYLDVLTLPPYGEGVPPRFALVLSGWTGPTLDLEALDQAALQAGASTILVFTEPVHVGSPEQEDQEDAAPVVGRVEVDLEPDDAEIGRAIRRAVRRIPRNGTGG